MITLVQFPWSPFCIVQRKILEYAGVPFRLVNIPSQDRSLVWRWTDQQYYSVPILKDGHMVLFETDPDSQVIAKYLDFSLELGLFPQQWEGTQDLLWRYIENEVEEVTFKLNDIYWQEFVPEEEQLAYLRHKERKFGRGCIERWQREQGLLFEELITRLIPFEKMLRQRPFLLDQQPRFVDFDLFGMLGNFLFSGHYLFPARHTLLQGWFQRMTAIKLPNKTREKLHTRHQRSPARSKLDLEFSGA